MDSPHSILSLFFCGVFSTTVFCVPNLSAHADPSIQRDIITCEWLLSDRITEAAVQSLQVNSQIQNIIKVIFYFHIHVYEKQM